MEAQSPKVQELLQELKLAREEVEKLKKELGKVNRQKEEWFRKREDVGKKIATHISTIAGEKKARNTLTGTVRGLKSKWDELNTKINVEVSEIKELKQKYQGLLDKSKIKGDPGRVLKDIEQLEFKLQTVPMSFEAEQRLMKRVKDLKKKQESLKGVSDLHNQIKEKSKFIDQIKTEANALHKKIQDSAGASQEHHEELLEQSKGIDDLRVQEKELYEKFLEQKKIYLEMNAKLKERLNLIKEIKSKLEEHNVKVEKNKAEEEKKSLKELLREVEEKITKGDKLTTEDLLVLQRGGN